MTLTPDGKTAYVANPVTNDVSVVDVASMKEVTKIKVRLRPEAQRHGIVAIDEALAVDRPCPLVFVAEWPPRADRGGARRRQKHWRPTRRAWRGACGSSAEGGLPGLSRLGADGGKMDSQMPDGANLRTTKPIATS